MRQTTQAHQITPEPLEATPQLVVELNKLYDERDNKRSDGRAIFFSSAGPVWIDKEVNGARVVGIDAKNGRKEFTVDTQFGIVTDCHSIERQGSKEIVGGSELLPDITIDLVVHWLKTRPFGTITPFKLSA